MNLFRPGQAVKVVQNPRAPQEEKYLHGMTGHVAKPAYSRLGYLRVHLDNEPNPFGHPFLLHPENIQLQGDDHD